MKQAIPMNKPLRTLRTRELTPKVRIEPGPNCPLTTFYGEPIVVDAASGASFVIIPAHDEWLESIRANYPSWKVGEPFVEVAEE